MTGHLDLDTLADVLAGEADSGPLGHLAGCPDCRERLDDLRAADRRVAAALSALPDPPLPPELAAGIDAALGAGTRSAGTRNAGTHGAGTHGEPAPVGAAAAVTLLPAAAAGRRGDRRRWLPAAAAVILLAAGLGYGVAQLGGAAAPADRASSAARGLSTGSLGTAGVVRNSSGIDYTGRASIAAEVPRLLAGTAGPSAALGSAPQGSAAPTPAPQLGSALRAAAPDPLARLQQPAGLADCLLALLPPDQPTVRPLALDYAAYRGTPALLVLLPGPTAGKLDVFVVGANCSRGNDSTLFYTSVNRP